MPDILLIEPDRVLARVYEIAFMAAGITCRSVRSAQSAIVAADKKSPELIICELQLISHSGIEFLYEFRSYPEWQSIPVIVLSSVPPGEFSASSNGLSNDLGIRSYLYKPRVTVKELIRETQLILQAA